MIKRLFDIIVSLILLLLLSPLFLIISILVFIKIGRPVFFIQKRPGLNGIIFHMIKFRSMNNKKDNNSKLLPAEERLTHFGIFLRKTSLDEFPELVNVLKGDMSLVGPRPLRVEYLPHYSKEQAKRHLIKPGITGWAQVKGRNAISWEEKFKLDIWYVNNQSFFLDLKILWLTLIKVIKRENVNNADQKITKPFKNVKLYS